MITVALIVIILVQNSSGDMGSLSGSSSTNFMSGRAAASFITRATSFLGAAFILTSLALGIITSRNHEGAGSIMDKLSRPAPVSAPLSNAKPTATAPAAPAAQQPATTPSMPAAPAQPTVPRPE
jgi:preprotein translocase subunit SecG